jgi:hypothetical protein
MRLKSLKMRTQLDISLQSHSHAISLISPSAGYIYASWAFGLVFFFEKMLYTFWCILSVNYIYDFRWPEARDP